MGTLAIPDLYPMLRRRVVRLSNELVLDHPWPGSGGNSTDENPRWLAALASLSSAEGKLAIRESRRASPPDHFSPEGLTKAVQ